MTVLREIRLPKNRSLLLLGPRQTGKSTLLGARLPERSWTVNLLEQDTFLYYSKDPAQFRRDAAAKIKAGAKTIFVDEIQKIPALLDEVHGLIEAHKSVKFWLSGSSARKLKRGGANLLAGRASIRHLHPLSWREQGESFDLARTLRLGSLPAVWLGDEENAFDLLRGYAETYLREEIKEEALVRNLGGFARLLDVVAAENGQLVNFSALGREAGLATRTVQQYFELLEDTLVLYRLEPYLRSKRARMVAHPRCFLFDTGVTNALCGRIKSTLDRELFGRLFEQWIILECKRAIDYFESEARLYFWRTHNGAEVDLLVERAGKLTLAVEIKSTEKVAGADLTGLRTFADAHPGVRRVVCARVPRTFELDGVLIQPYEDFLRELPNLLT